MSRHLVDLLDELRGRLSRIAAEVQRLVEQAVDAIGTCDIDLARRVVSADENIDQEEVQIEQAAIDLLALFQPAAGDLRLITTIIKVNNDLERIADCASNAASRVIPLARRDRQNESFNGAGTRGYVPPADLKLIGNSVVTTLRDAIKAFNLSDVELARHVLRGDDVVDALYHQIVQDMLLRMEADGHHANANLATIMIAKNLERIADHCTNIAEDVIYVQSGKIVRHMHTT